MSIDGLITRAKIRLYFGTKFEGLYTSKDEALTQIHLQQLALARIDSATPGYLTSASSTGLESRLGMLHSAAIAKRSYKEGIEERHWEESDGSFLTDVLRAAAESLAEMVHPRGSLEYMKTEVSVLEYALGKVRDAKEQGRPISMQEIISPYERELREQAEELLSEKY